MQKDMTESGRLITFILMILKLSECIIRALQNLTNAAEDNNFFGCLN
jgi:hypothetical protein